MLDGHSMSEGNREQIDTRVWRCTLHNRYFAPLENCPDCQPDSQRGYYLKYKIEKADGTPLDPNAKYFVLRHDNSPAARVALAIYANEVKQEYPELAKDLWDILRGYGFTEH
jgi:hypothetical protein